MTDVVIERYNTNDESYMLIKFLVEEKSHIVKGQAIAEIDTSKTVIEIEAPESGFITFIGSPGQTFSIGEPFCQISPDINEKIELPSENNSAMIKEPMNADGGSNENNTGFQVTRGYEKADKEKRNIRSSTAKNRIDVSNSNLPKFTSLLVDSRKKSEIQNLSITNVSGLTSCIHKVLEIGPRSYHVNGIFGKNISDILIYELSRLIKKYPLLNAFYDDDKVNKYSELLIGYAVDISDDLIVYNLGDCSNFSLANIRNQIELVLECHLTKKIPQQYLTNTTITLTDLSGADISSFFPLINGHQSCILGYSMTQHQACLSLTFDHRILSGRYVALFLDELSTRVVSHFNETFSEDIECFFCMKSLKTILEFGEKGMLQIRRFDNQVVDCCRICFDGW